MNEYILKNYKEPLCWKYSHEYRTRYMYSDRRVFDETNIVILYKCDYRNRNYYYIDACEYYEYGGNESGYGFTSFGFHMDIVETIEAKDEEDAFIKFVTELHDNWLVPYIDLEKMEDNNDNECIDKPNKKKITVDNVNYLYQIDDSVHFNDINDNNKRTLFAIASCKFSKSHKYKSFLHKFI